MFGKIFFGLMMTCLLFLGCAQPKYVQKVGRDPNEKIQEEKLTCEVSFVNSKLCLYWYWEKKPVSTADEGSLIFKTFRLNDFDGTPVEVDSEEVPKLKLWMEQMGHGSQPTQVARLDVGTYRASRVLFVMPGEWQLKFQILRGSELIDEAQAKISVDF